MKSFLEYFVEDITTTSNIAIVDKPLALVKRKYESNTYEYASLQCAIPEQIKRLIKLQIRRNFSKIQDDLHITIKYGLSDTEPTELFEFVKNTINGRKLKITLGEIDYFDNPDEGYVYHVKVKSDLLNELHNKIKDNFKNIETYDTYIPHITLSYEQQKQDISENLLNGIEFDINTIQYSSQDGTIAEYKI